MKGLSGSFPTNPYYKSPYWISIGISAAYVMRPSWLLFYYNSSASLFMYYYYYCFYSPIIGRAPDITTPLMGSPLVGKALDIVSSTFISPLLGRDIDPEGFCGWGVLMSSLKFVWGVWKDSPFSLRLMLFKRAASLTCPEVVFLTICGVTPVI